MNMANPAKADLELIAGSHNIPHISIRINAILVQINENFTGDEKNIDQALRISFITNYTNIKLNAK